MPLPPQPFSFLLEKKFKKIKNPIFAVAGLRVGWEGELRMWGGDVGFTFGTSWVYLSLAGVQGTFPLLVSGSWP